MDTIKWYTGDDIYILTILNNSFAFNAAFSQELRMNNNNASTLFPKIALAMEDEHLYVQVRENDGFLLRRNMEHGTAILGAHTYHISNYTSRHTWHQVDAL